VNLESTDGAYVAAGNHDPDGDSNGTSIVIRRPYDTGQKKAAPGKKKEKRMSHLLSAAALAAALVVSLQPANAEKPTGNIIDLGTLGDFSAAFGINNISSDPASIQVVGGSVTPDGFAHAFIWSAPGPMIDLGTLAGTSALAQEINNHGQIVGESNDASDTPKAVVWTNTGAGWVIENLGTLCGGCWTWASGINNGTAGDPATVAVAGMSFGRAVVWRKAGTGWTIHDLGTLPGDTNSAARDINDVGDVVGSSLNSDTLISRPVLWHAATATVFELPSLGSGATAFVTRINNAGDVTGYSRDVSGNVTAVRWRSATNWTIEDLGTLGGCCSQGYGINNFGDVVGVSNSGQRRSGLNHAFLSLAGAAGMTDLGAIRGDSAARDVNDFGYAVGEGRAGPSLHAMLWRLQ